MKGRKIWFITLFNWYVYVGGCLFCVVMEFLELTPFYLVWKTLILMENNKHFSNLNHCHYLYEQVHSIVLENWGGGQKSWQAKDFKEIKITFGQSLKTQSLISLIFLPCPSKTILGFNFSIFYMLI